MSHFMEAVATTMANAFDTFHRVFIVFISESVEAMNDVRPRWPHVENDNEEPESTGVEEENKPANYCIQNNKDQVVSISPFHLLFVKLFTLI